MDQWKLEETLSDTLESKCFCDKLCAVSVDFVRMDRSDTSGFVSGGGSILESFLLVQ